MLHGWISALKASKQVLSANSSNTIAPAVLLEENLQLQKENVIFINAV